MTKEEKQSVIAATQGEHSRIWNEGYAAFLDGAQRLPPYPRKEGDQRWATWLNGYDVAKRVYDEL